MDDDDHYSDQNGQKSQVSGFSHGLGQRVIMEISVDKRSTSSFPVATILTILRPLFVIPLSTGGLSRGEGSK